MQSTPNANIDLNDLFFQPLTSALLATQHLERECPSISYSEFTKAGVIRVIESVKSGRDFLQKFDPFPEADCPRSAYFEALKSQTRLKHLAAATDHVADSMCESMPDLIRDAELPGLDDFDVFAGDGHWHEHACHDEKKPSRRGLNSAEDEPVLSKFAVGHFYGLNLRSRALVHLAHADEVNRRKEQDNRALKRMQIDTLRQRAKKGRKVLWIWDRGGIDFKEWARLKRGSGIYFLSRAKSNMKRRDETGAATAGENEWEADDPVNAGVTGDGNFTSWQGCQVRFVEFYDAIEDRKLVFVTNLPLRVPPGVVAQLYRMRWDIEKVFDEVKNKQDETKAWASSSVAKTVQAQFICVAHNLMRLFERHLEEEHGITNEGENQRRDHVFEDLKKRLGKLERTIPELVEKTRRCTQLSVKFIRWIRYEVFTKTPPDRALGKLREIYAFL